MKKTREVPHEPQLDLAVEGDHTVTAWPPPAMKQILSTVDVWSAWYGGDPSNLARIYSNQRLRTPATRPAQLAGGVQGALARFWWGQPNTVGGRDKMHMPLAADIATASADLLFSEELRLLNVTPRLQDVLDFNSWQSLLPEAGEFCAAFGNVYLVVGWDETLAKMPLITIQQPENAVPVFNHGHLVQVTFWSTISTDGQRVRRLLEIHKPGAIEYAAFDGRPDDLGRRVPLTDWPETQELAAQVNENSEVLTQVDELTVVHVPNVRPAPMWHNDNTGKYLGRADISGSEQFLDGIDESWSSWMRDIRHGKSRIIAPRQFLESGGPGNPLWFNMEQDLFVGANTGGALDVPMKDQLSVQQFAIRTAEHEATIKNLIGVVTHHAGFSSSTFDMVDEAAPTATEVNSRDRRSIITREKKTRYWTPALERLLRVVQKVDTALYSQTAPADSAPVQVNFAPTTQQTEAELAQTISLLDAARAVSLKLKVQMLHPDWEDTEVMAEVQAIQAEQPSPSALGLGL